jgi:[calcium/calmodulin-dependent protein kinase] kinase
MKAVNKFKRLIERKRPEAFADTLGKGIRVLHSSFDGDAASEPVLPKSRSFDLDDRRNVKQALAVEGAHHDVAPVALNALGSAGVNSSVTMIAEGPGTPRHRGHNLHADQSPQTHPPELHSESSGEKGHAHDPLDEQPLFLGIGSGGDDSLDVPQQDIVAESPTAAEFSIYDTAYQQEVERIRAAQGNTATVYLTRRVDGKKEYKADDNMIEAPKQSEISGMPHEGFKGLLDRAREKQAEQPRGKDKVGGTSRTFSEIASEAMANTMAMGKDLKEKGGAALDNILQTMDRRNDKVDRKEGSG